MKRFAMLVMMGLLLCVCFNNAFAGEAAPQKVVDLANKELVKVGMEAVVIDAVKAQNAQGKSLDEIKAQDEKWKGDAGVADYMQALMDNACAKKLKEIQKSNEMYAELFVMDDKGANVCMTDKTSDYWQGDESKFQKSFAEGKGAVFVDEVEFDDSAQAYLVQVSVPVVDGGKVIGAITFGLDVDKVE